MPLIQGCTYNNPVCPALPAPPVATGATLTAPGQGDHVFGNVLGAIETALQTIFGGGQDWDTRMRNYNVNLETVWNGLKRVDFGHGANPPIVYRAGADEPDEHAHVFGVYSQRLQWKLCEIVCTGFAPGEVRRIGGATPAWKTSVLESFGELMDSLVDNTAIVQYITTLPNTIRAANPVMVRHTPMSLANARVYAANHNGPGKNRVTQVLNAYGSLHESVRGLLDRFDGSIRTLNVGNNTRT
jgi:hypothetical protein